MPMTEAQKKAAGERLRQGREKAQHARAATAEQMLAAAMHGKHEVTSEDLFAIRQRPTAPGESPSPVAQRSSEYAGVTVTHESPAAVTMFKPTPQGFRPRSIPATNIGMAIRTGWLAACPDCGRAECGAGGDQNDCPGREPRKFQRCPVAQCRKKFFDSLEIVTVEDDIERDPNEIVDDMAARSTPEARIWTELSAHLMATHPKEAPRYGAVPVTVTAPMMQPIVGTMAGTR